MYLFPIFWVSANSNFEMAFKLKNLNLITTLPLKTIKNNIQVIQKKNILKLFIVL
jgi:hypothetical protein